MTEVARSQQPGDPLPVDLLEQAPVGSRLVVTFGDLGGPHPTVAKIYDRVSDGWSYREQPDWETIDSVLLADCWVSNLLSWRLHHPGIVRVLPALPLGPGRRGDVEWPTPGYVCQIPRCRIGEMDGFASVTEAFSAARRHVIRHAGWARVS